MFYGLGSIIDYKGVKHCDVGSSANVTDKLLKACAKQLSQVFTDIFNLSLNLSMIPKCFKRTTFVPIRKSSGVMSWTHDYHPVATMKCFERLVETHIFSSLPASMDPLQCAYQTNRSIDNVVALVIHIALSHQDGKNTYLRMFFIDYGSAFQTIIPSKLNIHLCNWIMDFLTSITQVMKIIGCTSLTLSTGEQGCITSPLLYSLFTHDCIARKSSNIIFISSH